MQVIEDSPDGVVISQKQLAVEADGADFHDRTPEQAIRDRKRDRQLQAMGLSVSRFAGSKVWRDVFGCAREAVWFLKQSVERPQAQAPRKEPQSEHSRSSAASA